MNILFLGSLGLGLVFATPIAASTASAQPVEQSDQPSTGNARVEQGYRISDRGDFQIVEHGHWSPPYRPTPTQHLASEAVFSVQRSRPNEKSVKFRSNFQRSSLLGDVHAAEARFGLPHGLLDALIWTESRYNPSAVSRAGAAGLGAGRRSPFPAGCPGPTGAGPCAKRSLFREPPDGRTGRRQVQDLQRPGGV